jgi:hypothetical protein
MTLAIQVTLVLSLLAPAAMMGVQDELSHFHFGLWIGNAVTIAGLFLIHWDSTSTDQAFVELKDSKYKYKDL